MSQNLSIDLAVDPPLSEAVSSTPEEPTLQGGSVNLLISPAMVLDTRADDLMEGLFHDLDQALAGKGQLSEPPATPAVSVEAALATRSPLPEVPVVPDTKAMTAPQPAAVETSAPSQPTLPPASPPVQKAVLIERLLVLAACLSVAAVGAAWLVLNQMRLQSQKASAPVTTASGNLQTPVDQSFVDYVTRSLDVINRRTETQRQVASVSGNVAGRGLPSVAVPGGSGSSPLERVYVPLYQPPAVASNGYALPTVPSLGTVPLPSSGTGSLPSLAPATSEPPNIATNGTHVLVGVLELGDRSAALFDVNGTTQRINIGERIGTSGWALVSVSNQEAIVRRNGEVRSVYIGQQF